MAVLERKESGKARLDVRLPAEIKTTIERAATFTGQTISAFTISVLAEHARRVIEAFTVTRLSARDWDKIVALMESEAEPNERLKRAAARFKERNAQARGRA